MISKELLSEVLGDGYEAGALYDNGLMLKFNGSIEETGLINIHELAYLCKEWAVVSNKEDKDNNNGNHFYVNHISSSHIGLFAYYECCVGYRGLDKDGEWSDCEKYFGGKDMTEPEAIFAACQWILDNKDT